MRHCRREVIMRTIDANFDENSFVVRRVEVPQRAAGVADKSFGDKEKACAYNFGGEGPKRLSVYNNQR